MSDDRLTWALAEYLRAQTYLTHADRDTLARAFAAGWAARTDGPDVVTVTRAYLADLEQRAAGTGGRHREDGDQ